MSTSVSLFQVEDDLLALLNSEDMVEPEQRAEYERELIRLQLAAVDKRDRVGAFLNHCDHMVSGIDTEIERLKALKKHYEGAAERVESYIVETIKAIGPDDKGKYRKLEGKAHVFSIKKNPLSLEIVDPVKVPEEYFDITVRLSATDWTGFVDELDIDQRTALLGRLKSQELKPRADDIKATLKAEAATAEKATDAGEGSSAAVAVSKVPGARFAPVKYSLTRK